MGRGKQKRAIIEGLENRTLLSGSPNVVNNTTLTITGNTVYNTITGSGALIIGSPSTPAELQLANGGGLSQQGSIIIYPGSKLDLGNNTFIVNYGSQADPISTIQSYVIGGYANGSWNGSGIVSSTVQSVDAGGGLEGVGYADGKDGIVSGLKSGQIELMPTLLGDAKLTGSVNFGDLQLFAQFEGFSGSWDQGNFNYGSIINFGDFQSISANFSVQLPNNTPPSPLAVSENAVYDGTQLQILGTSGADTITLSQNSGGIVIGDAGYASETIPGSFASIKVLGNGGNDSISADSSVTTTLLMYGGSGNDTLVGGAGNCSIWGGGGQDSMVAGSGSDTIVSIGDSYATIVGGSGFDSFWANPGDAISNVTSAETAAGNVHRISTYLQPGATLAATTVTIGTTTITVYTPPTGSAVATDPAAGAAYSSFSNDPLFSDSGPAETDVYQGSLNDCYFLADLAATARVDPNRIRQDICDLGDGTYAVEFTNGSGVPEYVRIDGLLPASNGQLIYAQQGAQGSLWSALIEKAYAVVRDGTDTYNSIASGTPGSVFSQLGASSVSGFGNATSGAQLISMLATDVSAGQAVTYGMNDHVYTVDSVNLSAGTIYLRNQAGGGYVTLDEADAFADYQMGANATI